MIHAEIGTYSAHGVVFSSFASRRNSVDALFSICVRVLIGVLYWRMFLEHRTLRTKASSLLVVALSKAFSIYFTCSVKSLLEYDVFK